ncbi:MAG: hypothetical protein AAE976_02790 [Thermoplasmataceae archaeon]|jgi:hypothetical protein|nr:MAG: hypothetical protein RE469_05455 [Cuniculiplasma divulgatum]
MFKSERKYSDLDEFFRTGNNNSITGQKSIQSRINDLDSLYTEWKYDSWNFTSDSAENDFLRNEMWESIEIMRSSSINYIIGEFNSSIIASSAAIERVCNVILYIDFRKNPEGHCYKDVREDWIKVNTVRGTIYYTERWNRVVEIGNGYTIYKHKTLEPNTLKSVEKCGYNCAYLLNINDTICKNVFIERRKAAAHGDFSRLPIVEQLHGYVVSGPNDLFKLQTNKDAALDQYDKASKFIVNVINEFNRKYASSMKEVN